MKYILTISLIIFILTGCLGQYPKLKVSDGRVINTNEYTYDKVRVLVADTSDKPFIFYRGDTLNIDNNLFIKLEDAIPVIMLISDTSIINGKISNKVVWIKGYRVNAEYNTYYLDVNKRELPKNIIIWLDQNVN